METEFIKEIEHNPRHTPETLTECREHYVEPNSEYINCAEFGHKDSTNGGCWWCMEMLPYQWHMCSDESWVRSLTSPCSKLGEKSRDAAIQFIESYKQKHPLGNERSILKRD